MSKFCRQRWSVTALLAFAVTGAGATLGRAPAAPASAPSHSPGAASLQAAPAPAQAMLYRRYSVWQANGTQVVEFANLTGSVFAVNWQGPVLPDLNRLLGDYFQSFRAQAALARVAGQTGSALRIDRADLRLVSRGRMGRFSGYAYVPAMLPVGVTPDELQP